MIVAMWLPSVQQNGPRDASDPALRVTPKYVMLAPPSHTSLVCGAPDMPKGFTCEPSSARTYTEDSEPKGPPEGE